MSFLNYYTVLEIDETADTETIKLAFNRLAKKHHPDRNIGDSSAEKMMRQLNEAFETLTDPILRKDHDILLNKEKNKALDILKAQTASKEGSDAFERAEFALAINSFTLAIQFQPKEFLNYLKRRQIFFLHNK